MSSWFMSLLSSRFSFDGNCLEIYGCCCFLLDVTNLGIFWFLYYYCNTKLNNMFYTILILSFSLGTKTNLNPNRYYPNWHVITRSLAVFIPTYAYSIAIANWFLNWVSFEVYFVYGNSKIIICCQKGFWYTTKNLQIL